MRVVENINNGTTRTTYRPERAVNTKERTALACGGGGVNSLGEGAAMIRDPASEFTMNEREGQRVEDHHLSCTPLRIYLVPDTQQHRYVQSSISSYRVAYRILSLVSSCSYGSALLNDTETQYLSFAFQPKYTRAKYGASNEI